MAVCRVGREVLEFSNESVEWEVADGQPWPMLLHSDHQPAVIIGVELVDTLSNGVHGVEPTTCEWCAWDGEDAVAFVNGKPACAVHLMRALQAETTEVELSATMRGVTA